MSVISAQIVSTNPGGTTPTLVMLGPGNVELTNTNNQFTAGAVFSLYGTGALVIPAATPASSAPAPARSSCGAGRSASPAAIGPRRT